MAGKQWHWLCIAGLLALLLGTKAAQSLATPSNGPVTMTRVAIAPIESDVETAVRQAVTQAGGLENVVKPGDTVVIKTNLTRDAPTNSGIVTDPLVARTVVQMAREAGAAQVFIVEGTAEYREGDRNRDRFCTEAAFRVAGYDTDGDMVDDATGAPLVDLNDSGGINVADPAKVTRVVVPTGLIRKEYWLHNAVLNADVLISVPVLKNHYLAGVTLGMKNLIGLLANDLYHGPGNIYGKHSLSHSPIELDQHIVDLNLARRPDFVVVDGQRGMIDGPTGSQIVDPPMGLILAGSDVVAVDTVGTLAMGYDPRAIPYLQMASDAGLGTTDAAYIKVVGALLDQVRRDFPAPYADSPARRADGEPPTVAITTPEREEGPGTVVVSVEANDNDAIARVEFYFDEQLVGRSLTPPYEFAIDTGQYSQGQHRVQVVAYDRCLNRSEYSREVYLAAPTVTASSLPATRTASPPPAATVVTPTAIPATAQSPTATEATIPQPTLTPAAHSVTQSSTTRPTSVTPASTMPSFEGASPTPTAIRVAQARGQPTGIAQAEVVGAAQRPLPEWVLYVAYAIFALLVVCLLGVVVGLLVTGQRS